LQRRRFPDHELVLGEPSDPLAFQVAMLIRRDRNLAARQPWIVWGGTLDTRPMCLVHYYTRKAQILFVACHWTAFETDTSDEMRGRCADTLRDRIYEFLFPPRPVSTRRHVVIFGDFNAEPQDKHFRLKLYASRDRDHARKPVSYHDDAVSRTRLYSCGWRLLGEKLPHNETVSAERRVGTCYSASWGEWRTYDHVLVTGGLLTERVPYFDESALLIRSDLGNLIEGKPAKFTFADGAGDGLSDHYPLTGRIVLV